MMNYEFRKKLSEFILNNNKGAVKEVLKSKQPY